MKKVILILVIILMSQLGNTQESKEKFTFLDNISIMDSIYNLNSKINKRSFLLEICTKTECAKTQKISKTMTIEMITRRVIYFVKKNFDSTIIYDSVPPKQKDRIGNLLAVVKQKEFEDIEAQKNNLQKTLEAIDAGKKQFSGLLILNKEVPYDLKYKYKNLSNPKDKEKDTTVKGTGTLKMIDAKVQFFNNKASSIYIKAELIHYDKVKKDSIIEKEKLIFLNNKFSVALRYFNNYGSKVSTKNAQRQEVWIDYNDVFDYESDQFFNYSVANDQISLVAESEDSISKVEQRRFFDFFTAIIYSDVLSFNTKNSNSLLNAQAKLLVPLNLRNYGIITPIRQFTTTVNIALSNSFEDETRFISIKDDETFSNFDLLKKNNLYGKLALQAVAIEYKRLFLNISLGYSATFYRTGFKYTQTVTDAKDIVTNRQLLSLGHGPFLNFEIRPQNNFGADIIFSIENLNYNDTKEINGRNFKNDIIVDGGKNHLGIKYNLINVEANFYWLTNPEKSKGGIYAKLGTYYHTESQTIFPQIMVGYATNLTSFVNRFKPKTK